MASIGQKIYDMVANMMYNAKLDSPRFDDYQIYAIEPDPGEIASIDVEFAKQTKQMGQAAANRGKQQNAHVKAYATFQQGQKKRRTKPQTSNFLRRGITVVSSVQWGGITKTKL